jgi:hypothetical protein
VAQGGTVCVSGPGCPSDGQQPCHSPGGAVEGAGVE